MLFLWCCIKNDILTEEMITPSGNPNSRYNVVDGYVVELK